MSIDTRPLHRHGHYTVLADSHLIAWRDRSTLRLHLVAAGDQAHPLLRAWHSGQGGAHGTWMLLDLATALPHLAAELRCREQRTANGRIYYALRLQYDHAAHFLATVRPLCAAMTGATPPTPCSPDARPAITTAEAA